MLSPKMNFEKLFVQSTTRTMSAICRLTLVLLCVSALDLCVAIQLTGVFPRPVGFVLGGPSTKPPLVKIEFFIDPLCPDSKEAFPTVIEMGKAYKNKGVELTVLIFPLSHHRNAFTIMKAAHVIHHVTKGNKTMDWIGWMLENEIPNLKDVPFASKSHLDLLEYLGQISTNEVIGLDDPEIIKKQAHPDPEQHPNNLDFEMLSRQMFKYGSTAGVASTPSFYVNGMHTHIRQNWTMQDWELFLDGLLRPSILDEVNEISGVE